MYLNEAKRIVFAQKPDFRAFYNEFNNLSWTDYIEKHYPKTSQIKRKDEFAVVFKDTVAGMLGKEKAEASLESLQQTGFVSTADHHGLLCHPFFSNMTLARSSSKLTSRPAVQISLTVGNVSPTNSSFPRSLFFHDNNLELQKLHLISLKYRSRPLYGIPPIPKEDFEKLNDHVLPLAISTSGKDRFRSFTGRCSEDKNIWQQKKFCGQLTALNDIWWQEIFGSERGSLLYLEAEELTKNILLRNIDQGPLSEILFNKERRNSYLSYFNGITGAHHTEEKTGTTLFWYIDEKTEKRISLWLAGSTLRSSNGHYQIELSSEAIRTGLENYTLIPSMALCYSILAFYFGLTLGGGFSQIQYLGEMKQAWNKVFPEFEKENEAIVTDIFSGEAVVVGISKGADSKAATLADFLIHTKSPEEACLLAEKALQEISIGESLNGMMDELLEIVSGKRQRIADLPKPRPTITIY